ncbi:MAG TPA: acyltransferase family protein [Pseudolabrys sp.]|nr:acyltransferase family protein [Pseudolabrys sp.]
MRNTSLDAVRGIAILMVLLGHFAPPALVPFGISQFFALAGVVLFFLLSGYFMEQTMAADGAVAPFIIRRAARILPMYWFSIALAATAREPLDLLTIAANSASRRT